MPGGKRRLAQLFTSKTKTGEDGTWIDKIMTGSVAFATSGQVVDAVETGACYISEATIANLSACSMIFGVAEGLSASLRYDGVIAGAGTASIVLRLLNASTLTGASIDPRPSGQILRYVAFVPA